MPITPFHFGSGLLLKAYLPTQVSWVVFVIANLLIDVEPILWFVITGVPAHRELHSYLGAACVAAVSVWPGRVAGEFWLRWWNRQLSPSQARWLGTSAHIALSAAVAGALLGSSTHILQDSVMHADLQPFWPWSDSNDLLNRMPLDVLHGLCIVAALWGGLRLALMAWVTLPSNRWGNLLRISAQVLEPVAAAMLIIIV